MSTSHPPRTPIGPDDSFSAAFLAAIVDATDDAIYSADLTGAITTWNRGAEQLFGYTSAEATAQTRSIFTSAERLDEELKIIERMKLGDRRSFSIETTRRRKDGSTAEISLTISPIRNPEGRMIGTLRIARDIGEHKRAQERLRQSERRFRVTLSSIGDAVISTDAEGRVMFMNAVAEELTGRTQQESLGAPLNTVFVIVNELTRATVESPADKVLREGRIVGLANHTVLIAKDGTERPIDDSGAPILGVSGEIVGCVLVFRDVSERRVAELRAQRLAAIVDGSDDAIVGKTLQGIITSWNAGAARIFGYTAEEIIGRPITTIIPPERDTEEVLIVERLQRGDRIDHFETIRTHKSGRPVEVSLTISPIKDATGRVIGASKIARDITNQKQIQRELQAAQAQLSRRADDLEAKVRERTAQLEASNAELEAFSYSLSHDLRAPVRAIESFAEIVRADFGAKLGPDGVAHLDKVISSAARMDRMIQEVLAVTRLSREEISLAPIDPDKLLHEIIRERPEFQPPRMEITVVSPLLPVMAHEASLTQCLTNLLDNAAKFVAPGTVPQVRIQTEARGDEVRLWIEDNGIGIDREGQRRLFALFERLNTGGEYEGLGIGLAIVRKAIERMGGTAGVESAPQRGSRFWLQLARAKA